MISGKHNLAKKNTRAADVRRRLAEEEKDLSPFAGVVLKEKKEEKPAKKVVQVKAKKPGEIVQGYDPSASFADILRSYETTGDPYTLKKSKAKAGMTKKTSFGDILDQWEGKVRAEKAAPEERKSQAYKPTKSFAEILNAYEGVKEEPAAPVKKEAKPERKASSAPYKKSEPYKPEKSFGEILEDYENPSARKKAEPEVKAAPEKKEEITYTETLFKTPSEGEAKADGAAWSIFGGRNEGFVRPEKPEAEKKAVPERRSEPYKPEKSFGEILEDYGRPSAKKAEVKAVPEKKEEAVPYTETLFKTPEEDEKRAEGAAWSVFGGNEGFVRPAETAPAEEKAEEKKPERVSPAYKPTKSFEDILSDYAVRKSQKKPAEPRKKAPEGEGTLTLFKKPEEGSKRAEGVAWSIYGDNHQVKRPQPADPEEKPQVKEEKAPEHEAYEPTRAFSDILTEYDNALPRAERVKTFEELMKEKAEAEKPRKLTIGKLRSMPPQSTLDLHGMTVPEAEAAVTGFLSECKEHGLRKISIITGKGLHSEDGVGVLKEAAERILENSGMVREKSPAPMNAGGSGALWIILKEEE